MSQSVPNKEAISTVWQKVKDRSIPLKPLTKAEYDVLDETSKSADVAYLVQLESGLSLIYKGVDLIQTPVRGVYTQEEFDELSEELKNSGLYVIPNVGGGNSGESSESNAGTYSTEETRIGTWIDGKPLYRKIIQGTLGGSGTHSLIEVVPNIDTLIFGTGYFESNPPAPSKNIIPNYNTLIWYDSAAQAIKVYAAHNSYASGFLAHIIIEYTKTTD